MKGLIFTYLLTGMGAVSGLFNPYYGFLTYVAFATLRPDTLWFWEVPPANYSRIVAIGMLLGWVLSGCGRWQFGKSGLILFSLVCFLGWAMISFVVAAENKERAWEFIDINIKIVLPCLVGLTLIDSVEKLKQLAWVIVICQGFVAYEMNLSYFSGENRMYWNGFTGDNNGTAIAMVTGAGLAFFFAMGSSKWYQKVAAGLAFLFMAHSIMFAYSRGGMLGLIITGMVAFGLMRKKWKDYILFAVTVCICFLLAGQEVRERFYTAFADKETRDSSAQARIDSWVACWRAIEQKPVFGVGPENWVVVGYRDYGAPVRGLYAHSLWVQTAAEMGFPGILFLLGFYFLTMGRLLPLALEKYKGVDPWLYDVGRAVIASLIGFMISASFVSLWQLELPYYVALVGAGALKLISVPKPSQDTEETAPLQDMWEPVQINQQSMPIHG